MNDPPSCRNDVHQKSPSLQATPQWAEGLDDEDLDALRQAHDDDSKVVLESPTRFGSYAVLCLIMNRMIGKSLAS
jgi:hypothetical protein